MHRHDERVIKAFIAATRRLIDPHRSVLRDPAPYVVTGGSALDHGDLVAGAKGAHAVDADHIHLVFERGSELDGPVAISVGLVRGNVVHMHRDCRFWIEAGCRPALIANHGERTVTLTFDADGMDANPGRPTRSLDAGYRWAERTLLALASEALAAGVAKAA